MNLRELIHALAILCLVVLPLSVGTTGCKKKPSSESGSESKDVPQSMDSAMKSMPKKSDDRGPMDAMGAVGTDREQPMDADDRLPGMGKGFADPARPTPVAPMIGEKPGRALDGGAVRSKGHKGMLPMKGLVDPAD